MSRLGPYDARKSGSHFPREYFSTNPAQRRLSSCRSAKIAGPRAGMQRMTGLGHLQTFYDPTWTPDRSAIRLGYLSVDERQNLQSELLIPQSSL